MRERACEEERAGGRKDGRTDRDGAAVRGRSQKEDDGGGGGGVHAISREGAGAGDEARRGKVGAGLAGARFDAGEGGAMFDRLKLKSTLFLDFLAPRGGIFVA